ncbi:MAG: hypothetical protein KGZ39_04350 [Simkania sp.]|nr:hypothetical protein [Simkania sp.]
MSSPAENASRAHGLYSEVCKWTADPARYHKQLRETEAKIELFMQQIKSSGSVQENERALNTLMHARNATVINTSRGTAVFNTIFPREAPSIMNVGYLVPQVPLICTYDQKGAPSSLSMGLYRLSPSCLHLMPKEVLTAIGDLGGKRVDIFCQTLDTSMALTPPYYHIGRPANLYTHPWSYDTIVPGTDIKREFPMGLFPIWGIRDAKGNTTHSKPHPLAFDKLSNMLVHAHPRSGRLVYSPDDAHFMIDEASPFSITWAVVKDKKERVLITRIIMLHDLRRDPIMAALAHATQDGGHLDAHLGVLSSNVDRAIQDVLHLPKQALEQGNFVPFLQLPEWHKKNIYKHASTIKGSSGDSVADFDNLQLGAALEIHAQELLHILVRQPVELLSDSVAIRSMHDEGSKQLIALAEKFDDHDSSAMEDFATLAGDLQKEVFLALWRLNGHPRTDLDFARKYFAVCSDDERARALYLAASSKPLASLEVPKKKSEATASEEVFLGHDDGLIEKLGRLIQRIEILKANPRSLERTQQLHNLFDQLHIDKQAKYDIYDNIGTRAGKAPEDRRAYGRAHLADSLSGLQAILREFIE